MKSVLIAAAALAILPLGATGYVEAMYPLQQVLNESETIAEGTLEKVDKENHTAVMKVTQSLKGTCTYTHIRMNFSGGQAFHPDAIKKHLVVGAPMLIFYNAGRQAQAYLNRFFFQLYGDAGAPPEKAWWNYTHIEIRMNRTFNGTAPELSDTVRKALSGKAKAPSPNGKVKAMDAATLKLLPAFGEPVDEAALPAPFIKGDAKPAAPRAPENPAGAVAGLKYEYFEGQWNVLPDFNALKPVEKGVAAVVDLAKVKKHEQIGLRFTGFIDVPKDGDYTFYTLSDDGSALFIGKTDVVTNDGEHPPVEMMGEISLKAGKHAITITFFENSGGEHLQALWSGPGFAKQPIPAAAFFHVP